MQQNVISLKYSVEYQSGSVVSREILKTEGGTVTVFAFDAGQGLSEHAAPFNALVQIIDGEAQINIAKTSCTLTEGQMIELPANKPHSLKALKRFKMLLVMIK
ncbi:MAG: cupin [Candidatus Nealsonbacteria bacterium RIFCSPLOWO2_01_FULL_41_9]|uniref:Cupin n=1 Tax=Candidatus Nealsonbacteria bacterium RIFCSPLOWO2_01_FULL_41_9 TaxID=1801671 RepID=A0A1G2EB05_9BACT|nr:MAG: cupin [Candidatus Nealsonbacteria bacterium RIFCSPLOWO2_01_FULL_41_9]